MSYAQQLRQSHQERRERLWTPRPGIKARPKPKAWLYAEPIGPRRPTVLDAVLTLEPVHDHKIRLPQIVDAVIAVTGTTRSEIDSLTRTRRVCRARHLIGYVAKAVTDRSYQEIGKICGGRDHSSALHGVQKVQRMLPQYRAEIDRVLAMLGSKAECRAALWMERRG